MDKNSLKCIKKTHKKMEWKLVNIKKRINKNW